MNNIRREGYRTTFKATALFGGVQVVAIFISILKSKIAAIWLGTVGFGIMSLFISITGLIYSITNLGLQNSAVKDIAEAKGNNDMILVSKMVKSINRWVLATSLAGALITIILSPWISKWVFKSNTNTIYIIFLSSVVFLTGIYNGHYAVLQATRQLKLMAKANVFGAIAGFMCSIPMFYFFRENGIVWAMILTAVATVFISFMYVRKIKLVSLKLTYNESFHIGLRTAKLGIAMAITSISVVLIEFIVKTFITRIGGIEDVGLYQAGWALNASYLGMVFGAMAKDYFPRLSQHSNNNQIIGDLVNQQAEIAVLILSPLIMSMIVFMHLFIKLLYSAEFLGIVSMTSWLLIGSMIKAGSWGISYIFLAKSDGKLFLFNELGISCITLPSYLLGYYYFGLKGIGYAYTFTYTVYFLWVGVVANKKYQFKYSYNFWKLFLLLISLIIIYPLGELLWNAQYITGIILLIIIICYSLYELNKRLNLIELLKLVIDKVKQK